jgi:hypothetical protein
MLFTYRYLLCQRESEHYNTSQEVQKFYTENMRWVKQCQIENQQSGKEDGNKTAFFYTCQIWNKNLKWILNKIFINLKTIKFSVGKYKFAAYIL